MKSAVLIAAVLVVAAGAVYLATRNSPVRAPQGGGGRYKGDAANPKKYASDAQKVGSTLASFESGGLAGVGASYAPEIGHALGIT